MKNLFLILVAGCSFFACSENSSSAKNEKQYALQLNENCETFEKDSSFWNAIQNLDLAALKKSIENCASLDISLYDTSYAADQQLLPDLIWKENSDSIIYYLIDNGMDSIARNGEYCFATEAMRACDTTLVRYALNKGFPVNGETVFWAISSSMEGELGQAGLAWYNELLPYISDIDSVRDNINSDHGILHAFCWKTGPAISLDGISEENQLFYFQDLINRGYSINQKFSGEVELETCNFGGEYQTELQKKFSEILIKAGADTTLVRRLIWI